MYHIIPPPPPPPCGPGPPRRIIWGARGAFIIWTWLFHHLALHHPRRPRFLPLPLHPLHRRAGPRRTAYMPPTHYRDLHIHPNEPLESRPPRRILQHHLLPLHRPGADCALPALPRRQPYRLYPLLAHLHLYIPPLVFCDARRGAAREGGSVDDVHPSSLRGVVGRRPRCV